jgi:peptidoglycan hydrolase CwlO-like protein
MLHSHAFWKRWIGISLLGFISLLTGLVVTSSQWPTTVLAAENCESISCNKDTQSEDEFLSCSRRKQSCWEGNIREAQNAAQSLNNTISILNGQIKVQELQIEQTTAELNSLERQVIELANRITGLDLSLDRLTTVLVRRVDEHYKTGRTNPPFMLLLSDSFNQFVTNYKYIKITEAQTVEAMQRAETQKIDYDQQKTLKEEKQAEVERKKLALVQQQQTLSKQRAEQQFLLTETKSNEARYQSELAKTLAELEAIQSIIAGKGDESKVRDVSQGETIASVIVGASACSTGTHLHFEVVKDGVHRDPAGYLKGIDPVWNNQPDGSFGFGGAWEWPLNNPARINQGYGMTYYARVKRSYGGAPHTGIDMVSKDSGNNTVKAVKEGSLYRGSIRCGGGLLRYVKVEHKDDSSMSTYYLHVNY